MSPLDPVHPTVPSNWVRRVEEKNRRRQDPHGREQKKDRDPKNPPGHDPDGRTHIIDDLA